MRDFYYQSLFLILGIIIGATLLNGNIMPLPMILIICGGLTAAYIIKVITIELDRSRKSPEDSVEIITSSIILRIILVAGSMTLWAWYANAVYEVTSEMSIGLRMPLIVFPLIILIVAASLLYDIVIRYLNNH